MMLDSIPRWGFLAVFTGSAVFAAVPAAPGVVNFVEGQTKLGGQPLTGQSVGSAQLQQGDVLATTAGRAEVLLSPGVFLRVGQNSSVRMISPDLLDTRVQLLSGNALVEAADLRDEAHIRIVDEGAQTTLLKNGVYRFNSDNNSVAVYDGKARVMSDDQTVELKGGHEVSLAGPLMDRKFDKKETQKQDTLYAWSKLRSEYLSEASAVTARSYVTNNWGFPGSGFYWSPFYRTYAWMPGGAFFSSPFGPSYYSPRAFRGGYYGPAYRVSPAWRVPRGRIVQPGIHRGVIHPGRHR